MATGWGNTYENYYSNLNKTDPKQFLGSNFDFLQNNLKDTASGNIPILDQLFGNVKRKIGATTDRNVMDIKEQLAQSGFRGTGANVINDAYKTEASAMADVSDQFLDKELQYKQNAINQLLGLNQFEGGQTMDTFQSDRQATQFQQNLREQSRQFDEEMDAQPSWWEGLLGSLIGGGAQVGSAALLASDKKLKKNIKKVAETEEGIPVVKFDYKDGGKANQIGFLSKDVKKKHPEAVVEVVNYDRVPMKISKLLAA